MHFKSFSIQIVYRSHLAFDRFLNSFNLGAQQSLCYSEQAGRVHSGLHIKTRLVLVSYFLKAKCSHCITGETPNIT